MHGDELFGAQFPSSLVGREKKSVAGTIAGARLFESETKVVPSVSKMISKIPGKSNVLDGMVAAIRTAIRSQSNQTLRNTTQELIPPKPKALLSA